MVCAEGGVLKRILYQTFFVFVLGLFSLTNNNKRTAKVYSTIKDLQNDIKKSYKIVILKSCIGYVIENNNNNIKLINNNKKQINQYRIHKIDEGKILKFEKFCSIETTKCDDNKILSTKNDEENFYTIKTIDSNKILNGTSTTNTNPSTYSKKSLFSSLFSNFLNSSHNATVRSTHKADASDSIDADNTKSPRRLKKSSDMNLEGNKNNNNSSKIVRVAKCYDIDTNAIVYLRETCTSEFMIDASSSPIVSTTSPIIQTQKYLSPNYLYDIKTLVDNELQFETPNNSTNIDLELILKRSTKMNRLPFIHICLTMLSHDQTMVHNKLTIIIYDVNKNKFLEYFLSDLLQLTKFYKFTKSINNDDLLNKYKAKLDWCMQTIHEFKFDVKLRLNYLHNSSKFGFYFEQYLFRTYSRRNFRRRTVNSASLPLKTHTNPQQQTDEDSESNEEERHKKENKLKRIIKFATSGQNNRTTQKQLSNITLNEDENKRKFSVNSTPEIKIPNSSSNYSTVRSKLASIFHHSPTVDNNAVVVEKPKDFVTIINIDNSSNAADQQQKQHHGYYKQAKKVFKRPTLFTSFKQSSFENGLDGLESPPKHYTSQLVINHEKKEQPMGKVNSVTFRDDDGLKESTSKRSLQNLLNINIRKKSINMGNSDNGYYKPKNIEVTAI
jgi:hypothetical protein